jgi:hypothetical protein
MSLATKKAAAIAAINEVFGDTSVDQSATRASLEELRDECESLIATLEPDDGDD